MPAARLAGKADEVGPRLQVAGVELGPAHGVIDVLHRGRIFRLGAGAEIERNRDDAVRGHEFVAQMLGLAVGHGTRRRRGTRPAPGTALRRAA